MFEGNTNDRPTVAESYAGAISGGNSRTEAHRTKPADLIASAGMSPYRMGTALMRLVSEWNSGAAPRRSEPAETKDIALKLAQARVEADIRGEYTDRGLTISQKQAMRAATKVTQADMDLAAAEHLRLQARATDWSIAENKLRFQRMKTLPAVRAALVVWINRKEWEDSDAEHLAASVLRYFLSPVCPSCGGSGVREFAGNNKRGAGKPCPACRNNTVRGELNVPHGGRGKTVLAYLNQCTGQAANDISQGTRKLRHDLQQDVERFNQKQRLRTEQQHRAELEAGVDAEKDTAAVAEHFARSMTGKRREA